MPVLIEETQMELPIAALLKARAQRRGYPRGRAGPLDEGDPGGRDRGPVWRIAADDLPHPDGEVQGGVLCATDSECEGKNRARRLSPGPGRRRAGGGGGGGARHPPESDEPKASADSGVVRRQIVGVVASPLQHPTRQIAIANAN